MALLLAAMLLAGVASAQDGLSPIAVSVPSQTGDLAHVVAGAQERLIIASATATLVGGPDSFELTVYLKRDVAPADKLPEKIRALAEGLKQTLGAEVSETTVEPPPQAGAGWQSAAETWVALRYATAAVRVEDLGKVADQITRLTSDAGAVRWQAIGRRKAPLELSEAMVRAALAEAKRVADMTAAAAGLPALGPLHAATARPTEPMPCYFQMGTNIPPMPVAARGGGAFGSVGTRVSVEVAASWEFGQP